MRARVKDQISGEVIYGNWEGGPYIDLSFDSFSATPFDVINVWDYETNQSSIPFYREEMRKAMRMWIADNRHDLAGYREMMRGF